MGETSGNVRPQGNFSLSRQSSVYSLTFDEFQSSVTGTGKDFGSMNMDELLKNIWSAEDGNYNNAAGSTSGVGGGEYLQRQVSLKLPRTLSQKTVDEVWRDILNVQGGGGMNKDAANLGISRMMQMEAERQPTLGETTLEEFLLKAGVVREEIHKPESSSSSFGFFGNLSSQPVNNSDVGFLYQQQQQVGSTTTALGLHLQQQQQQIRVPSSNNRLGVLSSGTNGVTVAAGSPFISSNGNGLTRSTDEAVAASPVAAVSYTYGRGRKTAALEKVIERRQRRMMKNRESAARSRARKEAYTVELEAEVAKLEEANEFLVKKQAELKEIHKRQVLEMLHQPPKIIKTSCLRRCLTGVW